MTERAGPHFDPVRAAASQAGRISELLDVMGDKTATTAGLRMSLSPNCA
ncbi:hypothetical protein [Streptomyces kaempferi]|uniref:Uncharacterized protein n=1 Tax=Streptomyces kaempferi TaxID=333725 RepID=A0ABW3XSZ8_9ACTN